MYHCYFLINYIGPPKVFFFPLAPSVKSLPITDLDHNRDPWWAVTNTVMNIRFPQMSKKIRGIATISLNRTVWHS